MNLRDLINKYLNDGYGEQDALSKVCQDIILLKIGKSRFKEHITIKGGVVMHNISKDKRRATRDIDMDFIKYSLDDESIVKFIDKLNSTNDGINISIVGNIMKLHHQDYDGKRVNIRLFDEFKNEIMSKLDIGVHKQFDIEQDDYYFDIDIIDEGVSLLINSCEQMFTEKLKSLLKFGIRSTRYKDIFDFYYLISEKKVNTNKLVKYIDLLIFKDDLMEENSLDDIINRISSVLMNRRYQAMLNNADNNWLELSVDTVVKGVLSFFESLKTIEVYN